MEFFPELIPLDLQSIPHWVCWRREGSHKVPVDPGTGLRASVKDSSTWRTFSESVQIARSECLGIGFVLSLSDPFCGVDLDHCITDGLVSGWAQKIASDLRTYTEISPSCCGLHLIARAVLPNGVKHRKGSVEIYDRDRFFCLTGNRVSAWPVRNCQSEVEILLRDLSLFGPVKQEIARGNPVVLPDASDTELLQRARSASNGPRFSALYDLGDWRGCGYPSQSEADLALCQILSFWLGRDASRVDRAFRSSGLMRGKWDSARGASTYGGRTVALACNLQQKTFLKPADQWLVSRRLK